MGWPYDPETYMQDRRDESGGPDACWPWTRHKRSAGGYGGAQFDCLDGKGRRAVYASRAAWVDFHKVPVPEGMDVCHSCDNPICVNPAHLWVGTRSENILDASNKGRLPRAKGADHWTAVLSDEQALQILWQYKNGEPNQSELARQYGVASATVWRIVNRQGRWQRLDHDSSRQPSSDK